MTETRMCPDDCCSGPPSPPQPVTCPGTGKAGPAAGWRTVAALLARPLPERQDFWLCQDPLCDIVYFGSRGAQIRVGDLRFMPGFKRGGDLLCYCYGVRRGELAAEIIRTGTTPTLDRIAELVKAGACACEVRNPAGKCCLRDLRQAITDLTSPAPEAAP
jgi:hypothetical protein